jgi:hypothetical protein
LENQVIRDNSSGGVLAKKRDNKRAASSQANKLSEGTPLARKKVSESLDQRQSKKSQLEPGLSKTTKRESAPEHQPVVVKIENSLTDIQGK